MTSLLSDGHPLTWHHATQSQWQVGHAGDSRHPGLHICDQMLSMNLNTQGSRVLALSPSWALWAFRQKPQEKGLVSSSKIRQHYGLLRSTTSNPYIAIQLITA